MSEWQTGKTLFRLLRQKQSVLSMSCLSRLFWHATSVRNFRTFTVCYNKVGKRAKIRNRRNQAPHLSQDTNGKVTTLQLDITNESQEASLLPVSLNLHPPIN